MPIDSIKHQDKRANIPTEELRDFVVDDEKAPKAILYPRDPSLDPQLVWKGKEEQDAQDLEVESVPIYIQEKIKPQAIIEDLRAQSKRDNPAPQLDWFSDFNGIEFEKQIDFYQWERNWANRMILGDSLLVMNSLAEKEGLKGQVQMIYIDPPYGIKFGSNWQVSTRKRDVKDGKVEDVTRQPEQIKAFRDTWELGIHSYLTYLRDRLVVARELLTESGSVFVQIGDENVHLVRCLMDEVFGSENFCSLITFRTATSQPSHIISSVSDYLLWYAKNRNELKCKPICRSRLLSEKTSTYNWIELQDGTCRRLTSAEASGKVGIPEGCLFKDADLTRKLKPEEKQREVKYSGCVYILPGVLQYDEGIERLIHSNRIVVVNDRLCGKRYETDFPVVRYTNLWEDTIMGTFALSKDPKVYIVQTNTKVIERCLLMTTDPGDLVLDPTCGGGTTAYVAEQWGRRWITIDTSRVALALARTRLMSARYPYYLLADSPEGVLKEAFLTGDTQRAIDAKPAGDLKKGFVYERVPHITLKSIANNPEIDAIHAKGQEKLDPIRAEINRLAGKKWEEWDIPRPEDIDESATTAFQSAIETWWELRRERQQEIDTAIARHADTEILYDKPYEDNAYFTGGDEPYDKLSRALRAEIDEAAWATLYRTQSLTFEPPESGKIAVKVINHYGDEVLKVYDKSHWEI